MTYLELIEWLGDGYPRVRYSRDLDALDFINDEVNLLGVVAFRNKLREMGCSPIPQIVKSFGDKWRPRRCVELALIDGVNQYILLVELRNLTDSGRYLWTSGGYIQAAHYHGYNNPVTGSLNSIHDWIAHGDECEDCGIHFINTNSDREDHVCPVCARNFPEHSYNTQAQDVLGFEDTKEIRFGVELEYEGVTARDVVRHLKGHAIGKRDGSISHGIEVVTKPARMSTHKEALKKFFVKVKTQAHSNTGMHVHIERSKISEYQVGFMMEFLNREELATKIVTIAGRDYTRNHYCKNNNKYKMTTGLNWDTKLRRTATDKYTAFNTAKRTTVEVRIFASPESYLECAARLEFIEGLVKYSSPYSVSVKNLKDKFKWDTFKTYMENNYKEFPNFHALYQGVI